MTKKKRNKRSKSKDYTVSEQPTGRYQFAQQLNGDQQRIRNFRKRRNSLVCKLLDENPNMLRQEALNLANKTLREKQTGKKPHKRSNRNTVAKAQDSHP